MVATDVLLASFRAVATATLGVATVAAVRRRDKPVAPPFIWLLGVLAVWGGLVLLPGQFWIPRPQAEPIQSAMELAKFATGGTVPLLAFAYISRYTGRGQYLTSRRGGVLLMPLVIVTGVLALREGLKASLPSAVVGLTVVAVVVIYLYAVALLLIGLYLLVRIAQRYDQVPYRQVAAIGIGLFAPYLAVFASNVSRPAAGGDTVDYLPIDVAFVGFLIAGILLVGAMRHYPLLTPFPESDAVAREEVLENLAEGVVILDTDDRVLDINAAAAGLCQRSTGELIGRPIETVFEELTPVPREDLKRIELQTPDGPRRFELAASAITDDTGDTIGRTLLLRDITQQETREQRLEVLTRVLRHNLRNDLDTILAYTGEIEDPTVRTAIRSKVDDLVQTGEKARDIEAILAMSHRSQTTVNVTEVVQTVIDRLEANATDATISVKAPERVTIHTHRQLLERLVTELLENAIEHNDQSTPHVVATVAATETMGGAVEIEIADNGPGIPKEEYAPLDAGTETSLNHGTGVGLWLVNWIVAHLGGDIEFAEGATGTVVTVRLRAEGLSTAG